MHNNVLYDHCIETDLCLSMETSWITVINEYDLPHRIRPMQTHSHHRITSLLHEPIRSQQPIMTCTIVAHVCISGPRHTAADKNNCGQYHTCTHVFGAGKRDQQNKKDTKKRKKNNKPTILRATGWVRSRPLISV